GFYPAFSTDTGPLLSAALANNKGVLNLCETVFENRFSYKDDFLKLGINCIVDGRTYIQNGYSECSDMQQLQAKDLRAGAALVVAAIAKKGNFEITGLNYIDRGYENIEEIFSALGADIRRIQLD
ncbi:MAG: UDP-N-acetylglucosamine 1-carboxyvinyltransferase, partial [Oscillospiraceae bacterium]|nr:UDP-N-acetylglucosamine 1-carboxyvinyltransferase [Oscillospiraceae bacterium]